MLDRALVQRGHHSIVVANDESRTAGQLVPFARPTELAAEAYRSTRTSVADRIQEVLSQYDVDVIHLHEQHCTYRRPFIR